MYDLVEFGGAVMADYAYYLLLGIKEAKNASNTALYEARRDAFLALIEDVDAFKGTTSTSVSESGHRRHALLQQRWRVLKRLLPTGMSITTPVPSCLLGLLLTPN